MDIAILFIFGLAVGSFINVMVLRLKDEKSLTGRSICPHCHKQLKWFHNIPVFSFIVLKGKCAFCSQGISWQYPIVELSAAILIGLAPVIKSPFDVGWLMAYCVMIFFAVALFIYDYKWQVLPDILNYSAAGVIFVINFWRGVDWYQMVLGAVVITGFFLAQYFLSQGKWIGLGDVILGLFIGFTVAWPNILVTLILAYWTGAIVALLLLLLKRKKLQSQIPFGTFLVVAMVITFIFGNQIWAWYLNLIS